MIKIKSGINGMTWTWLYMAANYNTCLIWCQPITVSVLCDDNQSQSASHLMTTNHKQSLMWTNHNQCL